MITKGNELAKRHEFTTLRVSIVEKRKEYSKPEGEMKK